MLEIKYICGDISYLDSLKELWELLNQHHLILSPHFKQFYTFFTFEDRKKGLLSKAERAQFRIEIAQDIKSEEYVGYCITVLESDGTGEIESIFIKNTYRGMGIGDSFMTGALEWLNEKGAKKKTVSVAAGNEQAFSFYGKYGFYPRKTTLEQI